MKKVLLIALSISFSAPLGAATVNMIATRIFDPKVEFGVNDDELMMVQFVDQRPSFRRPGDEQCLEKFDEGPVPCDEIEVIPTSISPELYDEIPVCCGVMEYGPEPTPTPTKTWSPSPPVYHYDPPDDTDHPVNPPPIPLAPGLLFLLSGLLMVIGWKGMVRK